MMTRSARRARKVAGEGLTELRHISHVSASSARESAMVISVKPVRHPANRHKGRFALTVIALVSMTGLVACDDGGPDQTPPQPSTSADGDDTVQRFPDVIGAEVTRSDDGTFRFDVTISSPYDSPDRYADAFRVVGPEGDVLGVRELLHDHASEQPFTRSLADVSIPPGVSSVTVEARDLDNGWGGATVQLQLNR